jgi:DNA-binding NarL/FixJ family response regulator
MDVHAPSEYRYRMTGVSEATARNHVSAILGNMGVTSRAEAIVRARQGAR